MAEEAVGPDGAELTACGRAVVMPVAGSAFPGADGHNPRVGFFRAAQLPASTDDVTLPFVCAEGADIVDVDDAVEAMDEDEFCRCTVLRGAGVNILLTSSWFMVPKPLPLLHPTLVYDWKSGGATAVIGNADG